VPRIKKVILTACVLGALVFGYFVNFGVRTTRIETIRSNVNQNLALGASPEDVIRFLDSRHLDHSELAAPEVMKAGGHRYDHIPVVGAIQRNTWRSLLQREDVQLIFVFDDDHKLKRIDIFPVYTGL
jgi:hypothetical protein